MWINIYLVSQNYFIFIKFHFHPHPLWSIQSFKRKIIQIIQRWCILEYYPLFIYLKNTKIRKVHIFFCPKNFSKTFPKSIFLTMNIMKGRVSTGTPLYWNFHRHWKNVNVKYVRNTAENNQQYYQFVKIGTPKFIAKNKISQLC